MPTDKELIDASNLLGEYGQQLPPDWVIEFCMTKEESTIELIDPWGNEIDSVTHDAGISGIRAMVEYAREHDGYYNKDVSVEHLVDNSASTTSNEPSLIEAAKQVLDWYDRDGSVGGASEAVEALRDAMEICQESSETPS